MDLVTPGGEIHVTDQALPARRRLDQALLLWHRALDAYPDADEFCIGINSLIQALRSVTWVLQKDLKHRDGFGPWYSAWQERMRQDAVLRWLVGARNRIEKEGDLELRSTARVTLIASWLPAPYDEFDVPPLLPPHAIAAVIAERDIPKELRETGVLKVERRWVTATLPDRELLEACGHVYTFLDVLLSEAEERYELPSTACPAERTKNADELVASHDLRTAILHLGSGELVSVLALRSRNDAEATTRSVGAPSPSCCATESGSGSLSWTSKISRRSTW